MRASINISSFLDLLTYWWEIGAKIDLEFTHLKVVIIALTYSAANRFRSPRELPSALSRSQATPRWAFSLEQEEGHGLVADL